MSDGIHDTLIDDLMEAYVDWCEECAAVEAAYRRWSGSVSAGAAGAFAAYVEALDREELASAEYARLYGRSRAALARRGPRGEWLGEAA
jgi:hypothetical protein